MSLKDQIRQKIALGKIIKLTVMAQPKKFLMLQGIKTVQLIWQRLQQSFRLMVGVPDYQTYLEHMAKNHPDLAAMDEKTFHRYCVDARYPSAGGGMKKCPC